MYNILCYSDLFYHNAFVYADLSIKSHQSLKMNHVIHFGFLQNLRSAQFDVNFGTFSKFHALKFFEAQYSSD